jgi:2-dehydro-3-deoxygluconokinase
LNTSRGAGVVDGFPRRAQGRVVALGEAMIRLNSPGRRRLEQANSLEVSVGGAELNTLIVLSQLGYSTTLVTRLPENSLGRLIARHARSYGVDVLAEWDSSSRAGTYFIEQGAPPRATEVLYDRAGSAASKLDPSQFDWKNLATKASAVHVTGITCALGAGPRSAVHALLRAAREDHSALTSFDLNHRSRLWSDAEAAEAFRAVLPLADIVFASPHDLALVLGQQGPAAQLARTLSARFGTRAVVLRETERSSADELKVNVQVITEDAVTSPTYGARIVDSFGAGDVAAGAFLASWLADQSAAAAADLAARAYAHMNTIPGDSWAGSPLEFHPQYAQGRTVLR